MGNMNLICIGHAIKEVLSAQECLDAMKHGAEMAAVQVNADFLISDGGDGFLEVFQKSCHESLIEVSCLNIFGDAGKAPVLWEKQSGIVIIEVAKCLGLAGVPVEQRNIINSGSAGLADLVFWARERGARQVVIGLGGSATCDGGIGFLCRLQSLIESGGQTGGNIFLAKDMKREICVNILRVREWLRPLKLIACADVDSPLLGERGTARRFAPQKGASPEEVEFLECGMKSWANRVEGSVGESFRNRHGAGAAGGLGFAMMAIGAEFELGAGWVSRQLGIDRAIVPGSVVVTAEGKFDNTSMTGKAPWAIAQLAKERNATPVIFCGIADESAVGVANSAGVQVVEFGRELPEKKRRGFTASRLSGAMTHLVCQVLREESLA